MHRLGIFYLLTFLALNCFSQKEINFSHLTSRNGLSTNNVLCAFEASNGFIWFGTTNGLNRFDGYTFKVFRYDPNDSTSLPDNVINSIAEDQFGRLWVGTNKGLCCFNPETELSVRFSQGISETNITDDRITALHFSTATNILWVGTENGLNQVDPKELTILQITELLTIKAEQINKFITSIAEDKNGNIWVGMWWGGFKCINQSSLEISDFFSDSGIDNDNVVSLFADSRDYLWIICHNGGVKRMNLADRKIISVNGLKDYNDLGTLTECKNGWMWIKSGPGSIVIYKMDTGEVFELKHNINNPSTISSGSVSSILSDKNGIVWIATDKGVDFYNRNVGKFMTFYKRLDLDSRDYCRAFYLDNLRNLWISVWDVGLVKYNTETGDYQLFKHQLNSRSGLTSNRINGIIPDKSGNLWLASYNGINIFDPRTNKVIKKLYHNERQQPLLSNKIHARATNQNNRFFWIEPVDSLRVIDVYNNEMWSLPIKGKNPLSDTKITCIMREGVNLWIGTQSAGLNVFNCSSGSIVQFQNQSNNPASISNNAINDIILDHNGEVWIATQNGLNKFDRQTGTFFRLSEEVKLSGNECLSLQQDLSGKFWVVTSSGLDKVDLEERKVITYNEHDGLLIYNQMLHQTQNGIFICGNAERGFYLFHPDSIIDNKSEYPIYLTDFFIFNKSVQLEQNDTTSPLKKSIISTDRIVLNHKQRVFSFEFSMLNYTIPEKNHYAYMMEGFDDEWIETPALYRRATYTNLNPGTYLFKVKAANNDGYWGETEATVKVIILPPWWKTWWAITLYFMAILALLMIVRKYFIDKERLQHEVEIQKIETSKTAEVALLKQHFFTNISHEFRTPLTLISGPIEKLITNIDRIDRDKFLSQFHLIQRNANRLSQLTNQLLDIRKLETGNMKLEICQGNLFIYIQNIAKGFIPVAEKKQIEFKTGFDEASQANRKHWFDPDKVDKIVTNLLSNAFKFTPDCGRITLRIEESKDENLNSGFIVVSVEDSGIGIPEDDLAHIFDRFFRVEASNKWSVEGTGIGLSLTKELVTLLNGSISVESKKGLGSTFTVKFPTEKGQLSNYSIINDSNSILNVADIPDSSISPSTSSKIYKNEPSDEVLPLILLVEDNSDMRFYIHDILNNHYRVIEAENGRQGLEMAFETIPDMIISDVMMPEMDGFELTRLLKNDERTSHIPIVLLTALNSIENMLEGFENEADEYLTKPFSEQMLLLKVKNRFQSIQKLKNQFIQFLDKSSDKTTNNLEPKKPVIPSSETLFLEKLMAIIEKQLSNPDFSVQRFSAEVNMEASVFHRKLKAVINQSPGDFIRSMRMKRAAQLLGDKNLPINEIASMVGFDKNTNYFSTAFRKHFGKTPSDYQNELE